MTNFTFTPTPDAAQQLLADPQVVAFVNAAVDRTLASAQSGAPVHSGAYLHSLGSTPAAVDGDTVKGEVWSDSSFWHLVEFGSIHNGAYHVLERAVTDAGLEFQPR